MEKSIKRGRQAEARGEAAERLMPPGVAEALSEAEAPGCAITDAYVFVERCVLEGRG